MPPNILADYHLKVGIGEARFGWFKRAAAAMSRALEVAEGAGLHALVFRIERITAGLDECEAASSSMCDAQAELVVENEALREVSASLAQLVAQLV